MRRRSSRSARPRTPEKSKESETSKRSSRQTKRRKRSSSRSSDDSGNEARKKHESKTREPSKKRESSDSDCGSRTDKSHRSRRSSRRDSRSPENKTTQKRGRTRNSPIMEELEHRKAEDAEEMEEKNGKGKSKSKNKSHIENSPPILEPETQTNSEISENAQVTAQSPSNDNPVHNDENVDMGKMHVTNVSQSEQEENMYGEEERPGTVINEETIGYQATVINDSCDNFKSEYETSDVTPQNENETNNEQSNKITESELEPVKVLSNGEMQHSGEYNCEITAEQNQCNETYTNKNKSEESPAEQSSKSDENVSGRKEPGRKSSLKEETSGTSSVIKLRRTYSAVESAEKSTGTPIKLRRMSSPIDKKIEEKRRPSTSHEETKEQEDHTEPKRKSQRIKLIRRTSQELNEPHYHNPKGRARWGHSEWSNKLSSSLFKVDVDTLKIVCPSLEFLHEDDVRLETILPRERHISAGETADRRFDRKVSVDYKSEDSDRPEYEKQSSVNSTADHSEDDTTNIIAMNRKISIVDDTASKLRPPPSPAKNPVSDVLYITNLVRPFTVKQLKELLQRTGTIKEDGFWTDRIKSKCYVQYTSSEEAEATRNALHGVNWPIGNGKQLIIEYGTVQDMDKARNPPPPPVPIVPEKLPEKEHKKEPVARYVEDDKIAREREERRRKQEAHNREWDVGKENVRRGRSRSKSRGRDRGRRHSRSRRKTRTPSGDYISRKHKKIEESQPQKLMDDLFLKTKATPSIYWQPLSPEEIATKQQQRLIRMEEHKRRLEESSRIRGRDPGRGGSFRRRYD